MTMELFLIMILLSFAVGFMVGENRNRKRDV